MPTSSTYWRPLMSFPNNMDPDEAPQDIRHHLRSKRFGTQDYKISKTVAWKQLLRKQIIVFFYSASKDLMFPKPSQYIWDKDFPTTIYVNYFPINSIWQYNREKRQKTLQLLYSQRQTYPHLPNTVSILTHFPVLQPCSLLLNIK